MTEAPRWRLTNPHYLNVFELPDGTRCEWEHKETARETGRTVRKLFKVPILLNPADAADCNYLGEIIVAHVVEGVSNLGQDILFEGSPTPEMEPLNDAAQAITDGLRHKWDHPIESLPANGGMTGAESAFMQKMMEVFERVSPPAANQSVPVEQYNELLARVAAIEAKSSIGPLDKAPPKERRV